MSMNLTQFQDRFSQALFAPEPAPDIAALARQPGFAVYRNTVMKGCIDALQANYPSVTRLVGEEWFRAAAAIYVVEHGPRDARLLYYGEQFPDFLEGFDPAAG
ncbi:MAG: DNA-binding domain-containing protein, partial [Noviherbaspirillum sp.]